MVSTLWVIRTSQAQTSHFQGPHGRRGKGDLWPTHLHQHEPGPQLPTALD